MTRTAILLKPNVANILLFNFCEQKFIQHGTITIAIECNGLSLLIFEEKCQNYASGPKSAPNSDSFWVRRLFNVCVNLDSYAPRSKRPSSEKDDIFAKIGIFCKSIAYSFGGRIKLIICQIRHELSVTIHALTYLIGHYNPSVRIIDLVSHTTYVVSVVLIP